jgi:hypothetical protein
VPRLREVDGIGAAAYVNGDNGLSGHRNRQ